VFTQNLIRTLEKLRQQIGQSEHKKQEKVMVLRNGYAKVSSNRNEGKYAKRHLSFMNRIDKEKTNALSRSVGSSDEVFIQE
jgi:hypothetical protein